MRLAEAHGEATLPMLPSLPLSLLCLLLLAPAPVRADDTVIDLNETASNEILIAVPQKDASGRVILRGIYRHAQVGRFNPGNVARDFLKETGAQMESDERQVQEFVRRLEAASPGDVLPRPEDFLKPDFYQRSKEMVERSRKGSEEFWRQIVSPDTEKLPLKYEVHAETEVLHNGYRLKDLERLMGAMLKGAKIYIQAYEQDRADLEQKLKEFQKRNKKSRSTGRQ